MCEYRQKFGQSWILVYQISSRFYPCRLQPTDFHRSDIHLSSAPGLTVMNVKYNKNKKRQNTTRKIKRLILFYQLKEEEEK